VVRGAARGVGGIEQERAQGLNADADPIRLEEPCCCAAPPKAPAPGHADRLDEASQQPYSITYAASGVHASLRISKPPSAPWTTSAVTRSPSYSTRPASAMTARDPHVRADRQAYAMTAW
jgi:hypothetical protein